VSVIAVDLALLRGPVDLNLLVAVPVLQAGLLRVVSTRGTIRPFWVGFEAFGWAGVVAIRLGAGRLWYPFVEERIIDVIRVIEASRPGLGRPVGAFVLGDDTLVGLIPISSVAGLPVLLLALLGGRLVSRRGEWRGGRGGLSTNPAGRSMRTVRDSTDRGREGKPGVFRDTGFLRGRRHQPEPPQKPGLEEQTGFLLML
jgi:hypothetical protein